MVLFITGAGKVIEGLDVGVAGTICKSSISRCFQVFIFFLMFCAFLLLYICFVLSRCLFVLRLVYW